MDDAPRTFPAATAARHLFRVGLMLALAALTARPALADPYDDFNAFALGAFGAEKDPLVYERFGGFLTPPADWWEFVSESSAAVGFTTNLPARSRIEYGSDENLGRTTDPTDRPYAVHLHRLAGLRPGEPCYYRAVVTDERGTEVRSRIRRITPVAIPGAVRIPGDLAGPPYVLDRPDAYYLATDDLVVPGTAFEIAADGVTLDLGGHNVTYDTVARPLAGDWPVYRDNASFGVRSRGPDAFRVVNGRIVQGPARSAAHPSASVGFNPLYLEEPANFEAAGLEIEYAGPQMVGLYVAWPDGINLVHHNVFVDRGLEITNRHGTGSRSLAINGNVLSFHTHHNLVKRTRQSGLDGARIHDNEIYIDSYATNSYGIPALVDGREARDNRIFGTGYHVVGMGWGSRNWWHRNFIHLVGQGPDGRYPEYGDQESLNGFRLTQYAGATVAYADNRVEDNLIVITGGGRNGEGQATIARGIQWSSDPHVTGNVIQGNTIKVVMDDVVTEAAGIVTQGTPDLCGTEAPVHYRDNRVLANVTNVRLGDSYGAGCNHVFEGNELVRVGAREDYRTFRFRRPVPVRDQRFYDTEYAGGAGEDSIEFRVPGQEASFGRTLQIQVTRGGEPVTDASVWIHDGAGNVVAEGGTDEQGHFNAPVAIRQRARGEVRAMGPFAVEVELGGRRWTTPIDPEDGSVFGIDLDSQ